MSYPSRIDSRLSHSDEHVSVREEAQRTIEGLVPWAVSVLVHLGLVLIAFFVVWSAGQAELEKDVTPVMSQINQPAFDPLFDTQQLQTSESAQTLEVHSKPAMGDPTSPVHIETVRADMSTIGVQGPPPASLGDLNGQGDTGIFPPPPGGQQPATVVFCVDASGSMVDTFAYVIADLQRALRHLDNDQQFTVIFFQDGGALEVPVPHRGYKQATPRNVKAVADWITVEAGHVVPRGATDPISAVKLALGYQPQMMYLLSDNITGRGRYQVDRAELLSLIEQLQHSHRIKSTINTIQFIYPDPLGTLEEIAERNGGKARFVEESLIGR